MTAVWFLASIVLILVASALLGLLFLLLDDVERSPHPAEGVTRRGRAGAHGRGFAERPFDWQEPGL